MYVGVLSDGRQQRRWRPGEEVETGLRDDEEQVSNGL